MAERPERNDAIEELRAQAEAHAEYARAEREELYKAIGKLRAWCATLEERLNQEQALSAEIYQAGEERKLRDLGLPRQERRQRGDRGHLTVVIPAAGFLAAMSGWALKAAGWPATRHAVQAAAYAGSAARRHVTPAAVAGAVHRHAARATIAGASVTAAAGAATLVVTHTVTLIPNVGSPPAVIAPAAALPPDLDAPAALWPSPSRTATPRPQQAHAPKPKAPPVPSPTISISPPGVPAVVASSPAPTVVPTQVPPPSVPPSVVPSAVPSVTPPAAQAPGAVSPPAAPGIHVALKVVIGAAARISAGLPG